MTYTIYIDNRAIIDIQKAIDYYDEQQVGLGEIFLGLFFIPQEKIKN